MDKITLYKKDAKNKIRQWSIEVTEPYLVGQGNVGNITVWSGILGGKIIPNVRHVTTGLNLGKSNATTPYQQAVKEAEAEIVAKKRDGYYSLEELIEKHNKEVGEDSAAVIHLLKSRLFGGISQSIMNIALGYLPEEKEVGKTIKIPQPMLAHKYDETGVQSGSKTLAKLNLGNTFYIQPKIDGLRCLAHITKDGVELYSRKGEPYTGLEEIREQIACLPLHNFETIDLWIDGELYTEKMSFNALNGALRKKSIDKEVEEDVVFHIFDIISSDKFSTRLDKMVDYSNIVYHNNLNKLNIVVTETWIGCNARRAEDLKVKHDSYIAQGHEGLMIRRDAPYEYKRSWNLVKYKEFEDKEYRIVGFEESKRRGEVGAVVVEDLEDSTITFKATPKVTLNERKEMWKNQQKYIGTLGTVEYFGVSEYNIPRFPRLTKFNV